jgi:hypothetical protein
MTIRNWQPTFESLRRRLAVGDAYLTRRPKQSCCWQLKCGHLFTWPDDQSTARHRHLNLSGRTQFAPDIQIAVRQQPNYRTNWLLGNWANIATYPQKRTALLRNGLKQSASTALLVEQQQTGRRPNAVYPLASRRRDFHRMPTESAAKTIALGSGTVPVTPEKFVGEFTSTVGAGGAVKGPR